MALNKPRSNVPRAWRGGKPPELNAEGKALTAHTASCEHCKRHTLINPCDEGRRLYAAFKDSFPNG